MSTSKKFEESNEKLDNDNTLMLSIFNSKSVHNISLTIAKQTSLRMHVTKPRQFNQKLEENLPITKEKKLPLSQCMRIPLYKGYNSTTPYKFNLVNKKYDVFERYIADKYENEDI